LSLASVFGANLGDFASHELHLGHVRGLPLLAVCFACLLWQERRSQAGTDAYYWAAIVLLRTAATNLSDLFLHDMKLSAFWFVAALSVLLVLAAWRRSEAGCALSRVDTRYWLTMLTAGTLGTACGDEAADMLGLATSLSLFAVLFMGAIAFAKGLAARSQFAYWLTIVLIRTTGTNAGDFMAGREGLDLGLTVSTIGAGLLLVATFWLWKRHIGAELAPEPVV
jgi:uncharacterized membrane-anchored protein